MTRAVLTAACLFLLGTSMALADDTIPDILWTWRYDGQGGRDDDAKTVLVDQNDNVIVVGTCMGAGSGNDVGVVKYSPDGTELWLATIAGPGSSSEEARGAAVGPNGAIYICASSGLYPDFDFLVVEYTAEGTEAWRRTWGGPDGQQDIPAGIVVDTLGSCYVTGYTTYTNGQTDWVTMKFRAGNGLPMWVTIRPSEVGGFNYPTAIALGPGNSTYVTGYNQRQYLEDYATVKYSWAGVEQWASFYNYSGNGPDKAVGIVVDDVGDAYVTGASATAPPPGGHSQFATVKYASDSGTQVWVARYTGTGGATAIALGDSAVYVTGASQGPAGDNDYATIAYDKDSGSVVWATTFVGPPGKDDDPVAVAVLPYGDVLVFGTSMDFNDKGDYTIVRYGAATGSQDWVIWYNSLYDNDDEAKALTYDSHCNPIVTGSSYAMGYYDFLTIKYDSAASGGIAEFKPAVPARPGMRLAPNPARNWTSVTQSLTGAAPAIVSLLGVDGRVVRTQQFAGKTGVSTRLDLTGMASGVYIVRLDAAGRHATSRLVVQH